MSGGRGRPTRARRSAPRTVPIWIGIWNVVVMAVLILPILVVIPISFTSERNFSFPPAGFSLQWYENFLTSPQWLSSLWASLQVGLISAMIATIIGTLAAIALARSAPSLSGMLGGLFMAPMIVPGVIFAVAIYAVFLSWGLVGTPLGFVAAHTVLAIPFVVTTVSASLSGYNRGLTTAALSLGASPAHAFFRVTLPLILPGVASGFLLAFVTSFDESVIALFLQTPSFMTLPATMYDAIVTDVDPTVAAASTLIIVTTTTVIVVGQVLSARSTPKKR